MSAPNKIQYAVDGGDLYRIESVFDREDAEWIAQEAAEDYHSEHDGWESDWPLTISIYDDDGLIGNFVVEREYDPTFSASPTTTGGDE